MEDQRFDCLTHAFAAGITRRGLGSLTAAALSALSLAADADAKKKKKKKKKKPPTPPGPTCKAVQTRCDFFAQDCCGAMKCGYTLCAFSDVCYVEEGGACSDQCDCDDHLACDERNGGVCTTTCKYPREQCATDDDCCLNASTCGTNVCGQSGRCCQASGGKCFENCDCCQPHFCNERTGTCGNCAGIAGSCQNDDDCCVSSAVCGNTDLVSDVCCQPNGAACAFNEMCCAGLVCNPFLHECEPAGAPREAEARIAAARVGPQSEGGRRSWRRGIDPQR